MKLYSLTQKRISHLETSKAVKAVVGPSFLPQTTQTEDVWTKTVKNG